MSGDLQLDLDGISALGDALKRTLGEWDGKAVTLHPASGLGGDASMTGALDDFTGNWARAATAIDTFVLALSGLCHSVSTGFHDLDNSLAQTVRRASGGRELAE